jgi:hypothetical protein
MSEATVNVENDVMITGDEKPPVSLHAAENVHIESGAVSGDLLIENAEYVFSNEKTGGSVTINSPNTKLTNSNPSKVGDGYIRNDSVSGDLKISNVEDVFIESDAADGNIHIIGEEQRFYDQSDITPPHADGFDTYVTGWNHTETINNPETGLKIFGGKNTANIEIPYGSNAHIYITGWNNTINIEGKGSATLHIVGSDNTISLSGYIDKTIATESDLNTDITTRSIPVEDFIETTKSEAFSNASFGRNRVTYQEPATEHNKCPACQSKNNTIIARNQLDAFFIFNHPIWTFEPSTPSHECKECTDIEPDITLTQDEKEDLLR